MNGLAEVKKDVAQFEGAAILPGEELSVITTLEHLAQEHAIAQKLNVLFSRGQITNPFYTFSFVLQGNFQHLREYIRGLDDLPYYVLIDSLRFETKADGTDSPPITVRFDGKVYTRPESPLLL